MAGETRTQTAGKAEHIMAKVGEMDARWKKMERINGHKKQGNG